MLLTLHIPNWQRHAHFQ